MTKYIVSKCICLLHSIKFVVDFFSYCENNLSRRHFPVLDSTHHGLNYLSAARSLSSNSRPHLPLLEFSLRRQSPLSRARTLSPPTDPYPPQPDHSYRCQISLSASSPLSQCQTSPFTTRPNAPTLNFYLRRQIILVRSQTTLSASRLLSPTLDSLSDAKFLSLSNRFLSPQLDKSLRRQIFLARHLTNLLSARLVAPLLDSSFHSQTSPQHQISQSANRSLSSAARPLFALLELSLHRYITLRRSCQNSLLRPFTISHTQSTCDH